MKILLLDNYDSFTFNLAHLVEKVSGIAPVVVKNDEIDLGDVAHFDKIVLSPGPGIPSDAGLMPELLRRYHTTKDIFGVCLGLQAICECLGGRLLNSRNVFHGVSLPLNVDVKDPLFTGCPARFNVGRYHSWILDGSALPHALIVTARDDNGLVMAARHVSLPLRGVQFHPESVLSEYGEQIIRNWLAL